MTSNPAFQFYPADYLIDEKVQLMTLEQEGAYIRALSYCWREKSIPSDPKILALLIGKNCSEETARVVQGCFKRDVENASRMIHPRLDAEREKQERWREKSSQGGMKSAESRKKKIDKTSSYEESKGGSNLVEPKGNSSSSFSSSSSLLSNTKRVCSNTESVVDSAPQESLTLLEYFQKKHVEKRKSQTNIFDRTKVEPKAKALMLTHGRKIAFELVDKFFDEDRSEDKWLKGADYSFSVFASQAERLASGGARASPDGIDEWLKAQKALEASSGY